MGKILILNGSSRAPKSNSKEYAELFQKNCILSTEYFAITKENHLELCEKIEYFTDILLVFPLYADGIPALLLNFLKTLEENPPKKKPKISVIINCGFIEPEQNDIAVKIIQFFCKSQGYSFASVLRIGSGEAILTTPFKIFVIWKIKRLAMAIARGQNISLKTTMPLPKNIFIKASTNYWINYGKKNGITQEQMSTLDIESPKYACKNPHP